MYLGWKQNKLSLLFQIASDLRNTLPFTRCLIQGRWRAVEKCNSSFLPDYRFGLLHDQITESHWEEGNAESCMTSDVDLLDYCVQPHSCTIPVNIKFNSASYNYRNRCLIAILKIESKDQIKVTKGLSSEFCCDPRYQASQAMEINIIGGSHVMSTMPHV